MGIRPWLTIQFHQRAFFRMGGLSTTSRENRRKNSNSAKLGLGHTSFLPDCMDAPGGDMDQVWIEGTTVSLVSNPAAVRYRSRTACEASQRFSLDRHKLSGCVATVKSSHVPRMTAAMPSPKWLRSTRFAQQQSGAASARLTAWSAPSRYKSRRAEMSTRRAAPHARDETMNPGRFGNLSKKSWRSNTQHSSGATVFFK